MISLDKFSDYIHYDQFDIKVHNEPKSRIPTKDKEEYERQRREREAEEKALKERQRFGQGPEDTEPEEQEENFILSATVRIKRVKKRHIFKLPASEKITHDYDNIRKGVFGTFVLPATLKMSDEIKAKKIFVKIKNFNLCNDNDCSKHVVIDNSIRNNDQQLNLTKEQQIIYNNNFLKIETFWLQLNDRQKEIDAENQNATENDAIRSLSSFNTIDTCHFDPSGFIPNSFQTKFSTIYTLSYEFGENLKDWKNRLVKSNLQLKFDTVKKITENLLSAADFLKSINIAHLDIVSENILVLESNDEVQVKLTSIGNHLYKYQSFQPNFDYTKIPHVPEILLLANIMKGMPQVHFKDILKLGSEVDVYSIGNVIVELICRTRITDYISEHILTPQFLAPQRLFPSDELEMALLTHFVLGLDLLIDSGFGNELIDKYNISCSVMEFPVNSVERRFERWLYEKYGGSKNCDFVDEPRIIVFIRQRIDRMVGKELNWLDKDDWEISKVGYFIGLLTRMMLLDFDLRIGASDALKYLESGGQVDVENGDDDDNQSFDDKNKTNLCVIDLKNEDSNIEGLVARPEEVELRLVATEILESLDSVSEI